MRRIAWKVASISSIDPDEELTLAHAIQFDRGCPRGGNRIMICVTTSARKKYMTQNQKYPVYTCSHSTEPSAASNSGDMKHSLH